MSCRVVRKILLNVPKTTTMEASVVVIEGDALDALNGDENDKLVERKERKLGGRWGS
jgi:hypothetical protein